MKLLMTVFLSFFTLAMFAQTENIVYQNLPLFEHGKVNQTVVRALKTQNNNYVHVDIPEKKYRLNLHKVDITTQDFSVEVSKGRKMTKFDGVFYQGKVDDLSNSIATVSIFKDDVICTFSDDEGNFEIVGTKSKAYKINNVPAQRSVSYECFTKDTPASYNTTGLFETPSNTCREIKVYFEADYKLYQDKGSSVTNTVNYVTALFNQVSALYANEQVVVKISQIKVWNTPDPYMSYTNTASVLSAFRNTLGANFNGNLAHLLSTRSLGGGIAYVDVLCFKQYAFGVSAISTTFQNVPTYSWSVEVVTHELGHNIGSWHTQSCNWPNGALDNCYYPEGNCPPGPAPVNGGTIMSYCHLTSYGINFSKGFGPVPGNLIRSKFNTATCLTGTSSAPTGLQTINISNTGATLSWNPVSGTQSYTVQYKQVTSSTWITVSNGLNTSYVLSGLPPNTTYQWQVKTDCSYFSSLVVFNTTGQGSACSTVLVPTISNITNKSAIISWVAMIGVSKYHLQYKAVTSPNWIEYGFIPTNSLTLSNLTPGTTYMVKVRPDCNNNFGTVAQFTTLSGEGNCPAPIGLQVTNLTSTSATLSWQAQTLATGYQMQLKFPGSNNFTTIGGNFMSSSVNFSGFQPSSTYEWRVKNQCSTWSNSMSFTTPANFLQSEVIYPNPTTGFFSFGNVTGPATLHDATGTKVRDFELDGGFVDITNLPAGVYYLRVRGEVFKVIKI